jgi:hypothetical protein
MWQIMELGEYLDAFFNRKLLKIAAAMAFWVTAWQSSFQHASSFKPNIHYESLLGPYECKLQ